MISRRNIRVKVMQTLYTLTTLENTEADNITFASRVLDNKLESVLDIFTVSVLFISRIEQHAETDAIRRSSKYLQTEEDKNANISISNSVFVNRLLQSKSFQERIKKSYLEKYISQDWVKKIFKELSNTDIYNKYIVNNAPTLEDDNNISKYIWDKLMLENVDLMSYFEDELPGWEDDKDLIIMLMQNYFGSKKNTDFLNLLSTIKREYAHELLRTVLEKEDFCLELITPKLNNWDKERVALIDLLLIKMGVIEFLFFSTIPTKVTINEYIDIAKQYSTPQSGMFVNGVLDSILKDLTKEDRIKKEDK